MMVGHKNIHINTSTIQPGHNLTPPPSPPSIITPHLVLSPQTFFEEEWITTLAEMAMVPHPLGCSFDFLFKHGGGARYQN